MSILSPGRRVDTDKMEGKISPKFLLKKKKEEEQAMFLNITGLIGREIFPRFSRKFFQKKKEAMFFNITGLKVSILGKIPSNIFLASLKNTLKRKIFQKILQIRVKFNQEIL